MQYKNGIPVYIQLFFFIPLALLLMIAREEKSHPFNSTDGQKPQRIGFPL